jgi:GNAT superfamily N-acetyltransferase
VAETGDGRLVGAGGWTRAAPPGGGAQAGPVGHVRHLVTDHRRVRQGIGRAIMETVVATARAGGMARLECLSTRTAVPFYRSCGFEVLGEALIDLRPGISFPAIAMRRAM